MTLLDELAAAGEDQLLALADGFDPVDDDTWAEAVRSAMKGKGPETLTRTTLDGIEIAPLYTGPGVDVGLPGASPHVRGAAAVRPTWDVHVTVDHQDVDVAAERLRSDVDGGAEGAIVAANIAPEAFATVLGPVVERLRVVTLRPRPDVADAARALLEIAPDTLRVGLGVDPVGTLATTGWLPADPAELLARAVAAPGTDGNGVWTATLDATPWSSAGGSDAEVVGLLAAQVVHALRTLRDAGVEADEAMGRLQVLLPLDADQFGGLTALRALRRLIDRIATLAGAAPERRTVRTDVVMAPRVVTRRDPWVNLLRGTVVSFVAGVGGADGALVLPYDASEDPSALGRRLARTTQLVLREESRLARVDDPAGGSWYVEHRTEALAVAAWELVQEVDRRGGIVEALTSGWIAQRLADTRAQRYEEIATRRLPITGVSEFPDLDERPLEGPSRRFTPPPAPDDAAVTIERLPVTRFAQGYEVLRDASDAHLADTGQRPRVFLATLGPLAEHTARAGFARNLFAAGGIESIVGAGTDTTEEAAEAFAASGTSIVCVCGTDERYEQHAETTVAALRERGAARVYLAGRGGEELGADEDVRLGSDVLAALGRAYEALGIAVEDATDTTEEGRR